MSRYNRKKSPFALAALASAASAVAATLIAPAAYGGSTTQPTSGSNTPYIGPNGPVNGQFYNGPVPGNTTTLNGVSVDNLYSTISLSGSTAMRSYTTSPGISLLPANTDIFLSSGSYFGPAAGADQLAPIKSSAANATGSGVSTDDDVPAVELQWHEQGSVEGILELVTDQIGTPAEEPLSLSGITRTPSATNPVWTNENKFGATGNINGWEVDAFSNPATPGTQPQSPVQMAISDVKPIQGFAYDTTAPLAGVTAPAPNTPGFNLTPGQAGYGKGNPALVQATSSNIGDLGVAGANEQLVNQSNLNMTTSMTDPATGQAYAQGPWNSGGITNLQTNTVAITATTFAANPGTGMAGVNKTDARWLQLTGRLKNGATFNMTTRDINSGTRNTIANNTGVDPSWAVGVNDNGNTLATGSGAALQNSTNAADLQNSIDTDPNNGSQPAMRFSGKTAGSFVSQTVANNRMAIGTLGEPDALKVDTSSSFTPVRILAYDPNTSDSPASNAANFVYPTPATITDGSYANWQQEQYVTVKSPNAAFANTSAAAWAATSDLATGIKGDTANTSVALNANVTAGSNVLSGGNITGGGFVIGQTITSAAFPAGTTVTGITFVDNGNVNNGSVSSITVSNPAKSTGAISDLQVSGGDVANFRANILNAQAIAATNSGFASVLDPGDQLITAGFILPQFMKVQKAYDGAAVTSNTLNLFNINTNPTGYNATAAGDFLGDTGLINSSTFTPYEAKNVSTTSDATLANAQAPLAGPASGSGGYYGQAIRSATTINGITLVNGQSAVNFANGDIAISSSDTAANPGNSLFGNFNNNGIRDYSSFQTGVAALVALYDSGLGVDSNSPLASSGGVGTSDSTEVPDSILSALGVPLGSTSGFLGQRGSSGSGATQATSAPKAFAPGASKGDLIVMGDYDGAGKFDGQDLYDMAIGTTLSDSYSTTHLSSMNNVTSAVLNKNAALQYVQQYLTQNADQTDVPAPTYDSNGNATDASAFILQSARAVLTAPAVPSGATQLYTSTSPTTGAITGYGFTYDYKGTNGFNAADVNRDGVIDFNDAVIVDNFNGQSAQSLANQTAATIPTPVTGATEPVNLEVVQQVDNESSIGAADVAAVNTNLTGTGNANWYGYNVQKTGPGTINWQRTGGTVTVYPGASLQISNGVVQVGGTVDPFSDNSGLTTNGNHLAVTVDGSGTLQFTQPQLTSTVSSLTINGAGSVNLGSNTLVIDYTGADPAATIRAYLQAGYNGGTWNGPGIASSIAAVSNGTEAVGYDDGNVDFGPAKANQIIIENTRDGDANLDGKTNFSDLLVVAQNFGKTGKDWSQGDFNYDGKTNFSDLLVVAQNFGKTLSAGDLSQLPGSFAADWQLAQAEVQAIGGTNSVPEPTTVSLLAVGAAGLLARRRRASRI